VSKQDEKGKFYLVSENPLLRTPIDCPIKYILCRVDYERGMLTGYAYYLDANLYIYELQADDETLSSGHFAQVDVTFNKKQTIDHFLLKFLNMDRT
jgi:hypothetical protein